MLSTASRRLKSCTVLFLFSCTEAQVPLFYILLSQSRCFHLFFTRVCNQKSRKWTQNTRLHVFVVLKRKILHPLLSPPNLIRCFHLLLTSTVCRMNSAGICNTKDTGSEAAVTLFMFRLGAGFRDIWQCLC